MSAGRLVHILGGGEWQVPTIRLAKASGYRVLCTDIYAERPGYAYADAHVVVDVADMGATLDVAEQAGIDGIICDTTDVGVPTMAYVAERLELPGIGYETALNFTDKFRMRDTTKAAGVPNPPFQLVRSRAELVAAAADIGFPLVVKPVANQSSRGVHVIHDPGGLDPAFDEAIHHSRNQELIAEGFLDGTEVTVEGYCLGGEPLIAGISDKDHFAHRPEVANRITYPADLPPDTMARIREVNSAVVSALGLRTGVTHAEYMVVDGEVYLVEIAARGGGSRIHSHIAPYLAGVRIPELYLDYVMGGTPTARPDGVARAANLAFFAFPPGRVTRIDGVAEAAALPGVEELRLEFSVGDHLVPPDDDRSRPGFVVVFGTDRAEVLDVTAAVFERVQVSVA
jgi:carbamoyl-phosphate synthase large subunit